MPCSFQNNDAQMDNKGITMDVFFFYFQVIFDLTLSMTINHIKKPY